MPEAPLSGCDAHRPALRFRFRTPAGSVDRCLRHGIAHPPLFKTAVLTALVVGTILTAINQGNILLDGRFPAQLYWKIPLTFCVPYSVATWSALRLSYVRRADASA